MSSAYENAMSDTQANNYTQKYPVAERRKYCPDCGSLLPDESHEDWCFCKPIERRAEAAEARADTLQNDLLECGKAYAAKCYTVMELQRINGELLVERDEAQRMNAERAAMIDTLQGELNQALERIAELERANEKRISLLRGMLDGWKDYANGHYCQAYNVGMAEGLEIAALALEAFLDGWEKSSIAANPAPSAVQRFEQTAPIDWREAARP